MERRRFIVKAGGVLAVAGAAAAVNAPNVIAQPKVRWRMPTTWPPALDVLQGLPYDAIVRLKVQITRELQEELAQEQRRGVSSW